MLPFDYRLGGKVRYHLTRGNEGLMMVPDEIRKCAAFLCYQGTKGLRYAGTAFFVSIPMAEELEGHFGLKGLCYLLRPLPGG